MNPISKYLLMGFILLLVFTGILPSVMSGNWSWFGRSGSLITAYGIAITFFDLTGFMESSAKDIGARIDRNIAKMGLSGVPKEKIEKYEEYKMSILTGVTKSLRRVEFFMLITGTVIWGYGDLMF